MTYMRSTSKNEVGARARYARSQESKNKVLRVLSSKPDKQEHQQTRVCMTAWDCGKSERKF
jgi:hypothetical protein